MPKPAARVRLTERTVAALKPKAGKRYTVFDATVPGFAVRVSQSGHKTFVVVIRHRGRQRWITLGTVGKTELAVGRKKAREVLAKVEAGDDPTAEAAAAATFQKIAARFIAEYAQPRNRTWRDTERILRVYCAPWASRDITTIDRRDVRELLETVARDHGPIMSNRTLSAARKLFSWSLERDIIPANPAAKMEPVAKETSRDRVLSDPELRAFWRATVERPTPWGPYFRMLSLTGQRLSEVASMRWQDIDFDRALWTLPREATKTDRLHEVPLSPAALEVLRGLPRFSGPFVFTTGDGTKHIRDFSGPKAALDRAMPPREHWTLHDLRRTFATVSARLGIAPHVVEKVLNHTSGSIRGVAAIYNRYAYDAEKRHALELWAQHLAADNVVTLPIAHVEKITAPRLL